MKSTKILHVMQLLLGIAGYTVLLTVDWKIALGMFLVEWSININHGQLRKSTLERMIRG